MKIIKSRLFKALVILFFIGFLLGVISFILISKSEKELISNNLNNYITLIKNRDFNYLNSFINSLSISLKYSSIIWICGSIFILVFLVPLLIISRGVILSFSIISIIYTFGIKGVLFALILMINVIINNIIYLLLSFYSINFAIKCFNVIKNNKSVNLKKFIKNYFYIYLIFSLVLIISALIETFISSNVLKFVV